VQGARLKEGAAINKSLSALGNCISALADASAGKGKKGEKVTYTSSVAGATFCSVAARVSGPCGC